jgi:glycosyltransferase involved in cell wall biosynthesis
VEAVRSAAAAGGVSLVMPGFVADPSLVWGAADVVAVPSLRPDPFPNTALEAAAAGCCVVAAAHGGLPEMLSDGVTGVLVDPRSVDALREALVSLKNDPALRDRLGKAAADDVRARFTPARMAAQIDAIYTRVATGRTSAEPVNFSF